MKIIRNFIIMILLIASANVLAFLKVTSDFKIDYRTEIKNKCSEIGTYEFDNNFRIQCQSESWIGEQWFVHKYNGDIIWNKIDPTR